MLRDSQQELGETVAQGVADIAGVFVTGKLIVRVTIFGIQHPEVRSRVFAGALELADDTAGKQGWVTQMLRGEALRASSLPKEQMFVPQPTSSVPGFNAPPLP
jgi:hypothetical protein